MADFDQLAEVIDLAQYKALKKSLEYNFSDCPMQDLTVESGVWKWKDSSTYKEGASGLAAEGKE